jgi:hypothetical protein
MLCVRRAESLCLYNIYSSKSCIRPTAVTDLEEDVDGAGEDPAHNRQQHLPTAPVTVNSRQ